MLERPIIKDDSFFAKLLCRLLGIQFFVVGNKAYFPCKKTQTLVTRSWIYFNRMRSYSLWEKAFLVILFCKALFVNKSFRKALSNLSIVKECDAYQDDIVYPLQMRQNERGN